MPFDHNFMIFDKQVLGHFGSGSSQKNSGSGKKNCGPSSSKIGDGSKHPLRPSHSSEKYTCTLGVSFKMEALRVLAP